MKLGEKPVTPTTVRLRTAIVATAVASVAYVLFWIGTTQRPEVRAVVPFGEDPYDLFSSVAIVLLPLVGGLTAIRVIRYGPSRIREGSVAARICLGMRVCLGLVSAALMAAGVAMIVAPMTTDGDRRIIVLVGFTIASFTTIAGWVALTRVGDVSVAATASRAVEPDALEDLMTVLPLPRAARTRLIRAAAPLRRHRIATGLGAALSAAVLTVFWHSIREGMWASPAAALIYGGILAAILLVAYGLLIGPLRVLRAA